MHRAIRHIAQQLLLANCIVLKRIHRFLFFACFSLSAISLQSPYHFTQDCIRAFVLPRLTSFSSRAQQHSIHRLSRRLCMYLVCDMADRFHIVEVWTKDRVSTSYVLNECNLIYILSDRWQEEENASLCSSRDENLQIVVHPSRWRQDDVRVPCGRDGCSGSLSL